MKRIFTKNSITIEIKPLVAGGTDRLIVSVSTGIVEDVSEDGTNEALSALCELHAELGEAIDVLVANRAGIAAIGRRTEENGR